MGFRDSVTSSRKMVFFTSLGNKFPRNKEGRKIRSILRRKKINVNIVCFYSLLIIANVFSLSRYLLSLDDKMKTMDASLLAVQYIIFKAYILPRSHRETKNPILYFTVSSLQHLS